ncbi:MAG: hypothetical protein U5L07_10765 [Desulfobacterales bacterium]|nr:hypothetical protein [Desulfobacterales bacterium]
MPKNFSIFLASLACILLIPWAAAATLQPLNNAEMEDVTGQAGITIAVKNVQIFQNIEQYRYNASDSGYFGLLNLQSDVMKYNFGTADMSTGLIFLDTGVNSVASLDDWDEKTTPDSINKGMIGMAAPNWDQEVSYLSDGLLFSDGNTAYNLGFVGIGQIRQPSWKTFLAPHGESGVDMEHDFEMHIDTAAYFYGTDSNNNWLRVAFENIHIGQSFGFGTAGDDPADPTTWTSDIGEFQIGDMFGDIDSSEPKDQHSRPAQIDAGVSDFDFADFDFGDYPLGAYRLRLPFEGSIRFENSHFGGTDFGPGAIDGIKAYRFDAYLIP